MDPALTLDNVSKRFASHMAVDRLSFSVPRGIIYGVLGPNGAGKSTTLRMIMNILTPDTGTITVLGSEPERNRDVLRRVGYLPEERGLYRRMKVIDTIVFFARLKGVEKAEARRRAETWLERMGLAEWRDAKIETLSKGMQQKVQFISTVLHEPDLLILDEPFSGLDPVNQEVLRDTVLDSKRAGKTILFSTHVMQQAEQVCDQICIIAEGGKVLDGGLREIRRGAMTDRYEIEFEEPSPAADRFMEDPRWFREAERRNGGWEVRVAPDMTSRELLSALNALEVSLLRFVRVEPSLHEIFVNRVGNAGIAHRRPEVSRV